MSNQYIERKLIYNFFETLNRSQTAYILIKNIGQELPDRLRDGKDIDILVAGRDRRRFEDAMLSSGFLKRIPPMGVVNGYRFGYQLPEYQFWQKTGIAQTFYIDACFRLMCRSLTPQCWVPLDDSINRRAWEEKVWDETLQCWIMDEKTLLVYLLARCVFDKHVVSDAYRQEIEKRKQWLYDETVQRMLRTVFYRFTGRISEMITAGAYDAVFETYLQFSDY